MAGRIEDFYSLVDANLGTKFAAECPPHEIFLSTIATVHTDGLSLTAAGAATIFDLFEAALRAEKKKYSK